MEQSEPIGKTDQPDSPMFNSQEEAERAPKMQLKTCNWAGGQYNTGATVCYNHEQYQCGSNGWYKTGRAC